MLILQRVSYSPSLVCAVVNRPHMLTEKGGAVIGVEVESRYSVLAFVNVSAI